MKNDTDNKKTIDSYDYLAASASTTECTGLIPTIARSEAERESYESLFHFEPPKPNNIKDMEKEK